MTLVLRATGNVGRELVVQVRRDDVDLAADIELVREDLNDIDSLTPAIA